ncbi:Thiamine pyrophosphate enzyme family [Coccidioides posadasii C735 delta SOWgp]|uniref:Thiamine pyrophosphate enzyme family n=1 Tax=Coccidioides posadasii (strain C735) TaxID=222929 RepID=C5P3F4_COCP7|nr:Thiamine pyrophosphate enzyme family [Coccidioides posadasii C735 delta SOWgp]EER28222.1 Thiamine pyrophosphate enzyme family [Coccidioides posadasii C735 delta SOWgp]|eukprot:XP_003070367.1 Thiamine pyrophosphate enzyme family [Coccidioides posadasii C735 delta SOWgp]
MSFQRFRSCNIYRDSGYSNGLPGLATAYADRSSIFCITSSAPLRDAENNSLQGSIDQVVVAKPLTKFAHRITHAEDIPRLVSHAFRNSVAGPPGPVLIDFPIDVLFSPVHQSRISWGSISSPIPYPPGPHKDAIEEALNILKQPTRPVIIVGTGARSQKCAPELLKFIENTYIPIFNSKKYSAFVPISHPLNGGNATNLALFRAIGYPPPDAIILLGARTGMYLAGRSGAIIPKEGCKVIQVDLDGGEIGRSLPIDLGIVSDVGQVLIALNEALSKSEIRVQKEWVKVATSIKSLQSRHEQEPTGSARAVYIHFTLLSRSIICTDGGECELWASHCIALASPHIVLRSTGYLGFLGNGFGYALGCAIAAPDRQIINVQGDGSAGFHFTELDTYARFQLNIMTVVINNYCLGVSSNEQDLIYGTENPARPISSLSPATAFEIVAKGLGNESARVDSIDDIQKTVEELSAVEGPSCINLIVSNKPTHASTERMVGNTHNPEMVVIPYYDHIPRAYYKSK